MQKHHIIIPLFALSTFGCGRLDVDGATNDLTSPATGACELLEGRTFVTTEPQHDCGPAPADSEITCNWTVGFSAHDMPSSTYLYRHSDIGESGEVQCEGTNMVVLKINNVDTGYYNPSTDELTWFGVSYAER